MRRTSRARIRLLMRNRSLIARLLRLARGDRRDKQNSMIARRHHNLTSRLFDNKITSPQSDATSIRHYTSLHGVRQTLLVGKQGFSKFSPCSVAVMGEPDPKPGFRIGNVPCPDNHCVGGNVLFRYPSHVPAAERAAPAAARDGLGEQRSPRALHIPPSSPRGGEEEGEGEGEDHQASSAAPVLKPLQLLSPHASPLSPHCCRIAREMRMACRQYAVMVSFIHSKSMPGEPG